MTQTDRPISTLLATLDSLEDSDTAFITAAAINLYNETLRRKHGRILYGPADVANLAGIIHSLLNPPVSLADPEKVKRSAKPTPEEETALLQGMEEAIQPQNPFQVN